MGSITSDQDLRAAIGRLPLSEQRRLAGLFADSVIGLCDDERIHRAAATAVGDSVSETKLEDAFRGARAYTAKSYTACGHDTDWMSQAAHFAGLAAQAGVTPAAMIGDGPGPAWQAAMYARMARNCEMIARDNSGPAHESSHQYSLTDRFMSEHG